MTIIVNKKQNKIIEEQLARNIENGYRKTYTLDQIYFSLTLIAEPLSIGEILRIVEGEKYIVAKEIEVGDIVYNHKLDSVFEVTLGHVRGTLPNTRLSAVKANPDTYTLVTKRANKEEMK